MIGDKLIITEYHRQAAALIYKRLAAKLNGTGKPVVVTVAGESGCGKSETAAVLAELCREAGVKTLLLQQDDYFIHPPKTNHQKRLEDIGWVGMREVNLELIEANIRAVLDGRQKTITKPLVNYEQDCISEITIPVEGLQVVIVEGTYTTALKNADLRVFIDRDYRQTKKARIKRSRDPLTGFMEKVLAIEHIIISGHKKWADLIIPPPKDERESGFSDRAPNR